MQKPGVRYIATDADPSTEFICEAHRRGIRVLALIDFTKSRIPSAQSREFWAQSILNEALAKGLDGVNIDIENVEDSTMTPHMTDLTSRVRQKFSSNPRTRNNLVTWVR